MITIFIGGNAEGKTLNLLKLMSKCKVPYSSNIKPELLDEVGLSLNSCKLVANHISASRLITSGNDVICADFFRKEDENAYTREFFSLLTVICKDVKKVFLDEPTIVFNSLEDLDLYKAIEELSVTYDIDFYITTHSDSFLSIENTNVVVVEEGVLRTEVTEDELDELLWSF